MSNLIYQKRIMRLKSELCKPFLRSYPLAINLSKKQFKTQHGLLDLVMQKELGFKCNQAALDIFKSLLCLRNVGVKLCLSVKVQPYI